MRRKVKKEGRRRCEVERDTRYTRSSQFDDGLGDGVEFTQRDDLLCKEGEGVQEFFVLRYLLDELHNSILVFLILFYPSMKGHRI